MPRLRRRIPFPLELRDMIRGGIWHKSALYDGLRRAPPAPYPGRTSKRSIPKLVFVEDGLLRDFALKNPALVDLERKRRDLSGRKLGGEPAVSKAFVEQQLLALSQGLSVEESEEVARKWLVEHGRELLESGAVRGWGKDGPLRGSGEGKELVGEDGVPLESPKALMKAVMKEQAALVKSLVRERAAGRRIVSTPTYRSYLDKETTRKIQKRQLKATKETESGSVDERD